MRLSSPYRNFPSSFAPIPLQNSRLLSLLVGASTVILLGNRPNALAQTQTHPTTQVAQLNTDQSEPTQSEPRQTQSVIWVNPQTGNDHKANGSEQAPFRTLTRALETARANTVIQLAAGTYSSDTGEVFPITLKSDVTIQGNPDELGHGIVIRGGGSYSSPTLGRQNATLIGVNQAILTGVTVTNPTARGHGLWIETGSPTIRHNTFINSRNTGLVTAGSSAPVVQNNLFVLNRTGGLTITGYAQPDVRHNIFQRTGSGITVNENAAPQIISNRVSQNRDGIVVQGNAHPLLRGNTIEDSERDGLIVIAQAQPNLGTDKEPGNNAFLNNQQHDINALATSQTLPAFGNQIDSNRLAGEVDLTGKAPLVSVTTIASTANRLPATHVARTSRAASSPGANASTLPISVTPAVARRTQSPHLISTLPPAVPQTQTQTSRQSTSRNSAASSQTPSRSNRPTILAAATTQTPPSHPSRPARTEPIPIPVPAPAEASSSPAAINISVPPPERPVSPTSASAALRPAVHRTESPQLQSANAIEINVPPPEQSQPASAEPQLGSVAVTAVASLPRQNFAATQLTAPTLGGTPITIPVPPPEQRQAAASPASSSPSGPTRILPVPSGEIPVGNTDGMARVSVGDSQTTGALLARRNLQYRVVVAAEDEQAQSLVQSLAPDAFLTSIDGQSVMQVGAFSSRENAQEAVELLSRSGLKGIIQPME